MYCTLCQRTEKVESSPFDVSESSLSRWIWSLQRWPSIHPTICVPDPPSNDSQRPPLATLRYSRVPSCVLSASSLRRSEPSDPWSFEVRIQLEALSKAADGCRPILQRLEQTNYTKDFGRLSKELTKCSKPRKPHLDLPHLECVVNPEKLFTPRLTKKILGCKVLLGVRRRMFSKPSHAAQHSTYPYISSMQKPSTKNYGSEALAGSKFTVSSSSLPSWGLGNACESPRSSLLQTSPRPFAPKTLRPPTVACPACTAPWHSWASPGWPSAGAPWPCFRGRAWWRWVDRGRGAPVAPPAMAWYIWLGPRRKWKQKDRNLSSGT